VSSSSLLSLTSHSILLGIDIMATMWAERPSDSFCRIRHGSKDGREVKLFSLWKETNGKPKPYNSELPGRMPPIVNADWLTARKLVKDNGGLPRNVFLDHALLSPLIGGHAWTEIFPRQEAVWARELAAFPHIENGFKKGQDITEQHANVQLVLPWAEIQRRGLAEQIIEVEKVEGFQRHRYYLSIDPANSELPIVNNRLVLEGDTLAIRVLNLPEYGGGFSDERERTQLWAHAAMDLESGTPVLDGYQHDFCSRQFKNAAPDGHDKTFDRDLDFPWAGGIRAIERRDNDFHGGKVVYATELIVGVENCVGFVSER
jgi:hypothetical protein